MVLTERVTQAKRKRAADAGYGPDSELCNAILEVQGHQLHVSKEVCNMIHNKSHSNQYTATSFETLA